MNKKVILSLSIFFMLFLVPIVSADVLLSNSKDWQDVYSVMIYGGIEKIKPRFLVSDKHGPLILNSMDKDEFLHVISNSRNPYVVGYESMIKSAGFNNVKEDKYSDVNHGLAATVNTSDFIIVDDAYGYNAIAVAPYAVLARHYVLFANDNNIGDVVDILDKHDAQDVIIYGHVDRSVRENLDRFNPEIINKDGDRFANNVEIVKKYREINPKKQVVLTNGEFIESEVVSGLEPVLFIGRENVPDKIKEYIQSTDIEVGVLIGNELVGTATTVRRQVGISTFVKFAQGARAAAGAISRVEGLDRFPVPAVELNLEILSAKYNKLTGMIEITLKNNADIASYFKGTYTLKVGDQEFTFGDEDPVFIDKNDVKTLVYKVEGVNPEGEMTLDAYVIYGESKNALEFVIDKTFSVSVIDVADDALIEITKVVYNTDRNRFQVYVKNVGEVGTYVNTELVDVDILGETTTLGADATIFLKVGEEKPTTISAELSAGDLENNPKVHVRAHYGEREDALIKILEGDFEILLKSFDLWTYLPITVIVLLVLLLLFGSKKCPNCKTKNPRGRKKCKKCGHKLK